MNCHHKKNKQKIFLQACLLIMLLLGLGCKKIVDIPEPTNSVTTAKVFNNKANATSALVGIYSDMSIGANGGGLSYGNGLITLFAGLSSDELQYGGSAAEILQFQNNTVLASNPFLYAPFWSAAYKDIYIANAVIEGMQGSTLSSADKNQLIGEAKFIRAFIHFYLVNLFGDVPLVTATDWNMNSLIERTAAEKVYEQITADLKDAESLLPGDYSISGGERYRPNKFAAVALLARTYLYTGDWANAVIQSSKVIDAGLYSLPNDLTTVFLKNSDESIFQLQVSDATSPYATREAKNILPEFETSAFPPDVVDNNPSYFIPSYYLTNGLVNAFDTTNDLRFKEWVSSATVLGYTYFFPFKYKVRQGSPGNVLEYYTLLRLAEQYLIRAEARARIGTDLNGAAADLNIIRSRAGLLNTTASSAPDLLEAIAHERQTELFAEWGYRWFDLKRTNTTSILAALKPQWQDYQKLYPIPIRELQTDPNLKQNPGY